jgi:DNA-directed RNA polymerase specialized sigma24 family protein
MIQPGDADLINRAARRVMRTHHYGLEAYDYRQIGWLALLQAEHDGRIPADPLHRTRYLQRRVRGAMIDALRIDLRHERHREAGHGLDDPGSVPDDAEDAPGGVEAGHFGACPAPGPERLAQFAQAAKIFERRASVKVRLALDMLLQGHSAAEIARFCCVTNGAISRRLDGARALMGQVL